MREQEREGGEEKEEEGGAKGSASPFRCRGVMRIWIGGGRGAP